jgi:hypothetical protein
MFTNRFFIVLVGVALVVIFMLTGQEAIATSTVPSNEQVPQSMQRSHDAETARWQAMAEYYLNAAKAERSRIAEKARWQAMTTYYQSIEEAQNLERGRDADAARWSAIAEYYLYSISATR